MKYSDHYYYIYQDHRPGRPYAKPGAELKARDDRGEWVYAGDVRYDPDASGYVAVLADLDGLPETDVRWLGTCAAFGDALDLLWTHRSEAYIPVRATA